MSDSTIHYEKQGNAAIIRLNRPDQLNALTYPMLAAFRQAITNASDDPGVVGIVITGNGRGFSAGLDAAVLQEVTESGVTTSSQSETDQLPGMFSYLLEVPKPIIAAINGAAAGGGLILALMSDMRFMSRDAFVTTVFLKRGLIAEHGSSWILPRLVGTGRALDLLWASDKVGAEEAHRLGLVERVCDAGSLVQDAVDYVEQLAAVSAPLAIAETKRLVYRHLGFGYEEALRDAEVSQDRFVAAPDATEGAMSFIERRPPVFSRVGREDS